MNRKNDIFKRCITHLLSGNVLRPNNVDEFVYRRRGEIIETDSQDFEALQHGIYKKVFAYAANDLTTPIGCKYLWYCALDDVDLIYRTLSEQEQEALCLDMAFTVAMKKERKERKLGTKSCEENIQDAD